MALDKLGVFQIYQTAAGGDQWYLGDILPNKDPRFIIGDDADKVISRPNNLWEPDDHEVSLTVLPVAGWVEPEGACDMSFNDAQARGYTGSETSFGNVEFTSFFKITNVTDDDEGILMGGPTDKQKGSKCCQSKSYKSLLSFENPMRSFFTKAMWRGENFNKPKKVIADEHGVDYNASIVNLSNANGGIFGVKYIHFINEGAEGKFVRLQHWLNISGDKVTWVKVNEYVDSGGWGKNGDDCDGDKDQIFNFKAGRMNLIWDQGSSADIHFGLMSVREITSGPNPTIFPIPTGESEFVRLIDLKYHLGIVPLGICGFTPAESGLVEFCNIVDNGSHSNLHRDRYRVAQVARQPPSLLIGHKPRRVIVPMKRKGTPPDTEIRCVLRKGSDDSEAVVYELSHINGTPTAGPLTAIDLTTSKRFYWFSNLDATYAWTLHDRMSIEYSGNDVDTTNEVDVYRNSSGPFDGANSCLIRFDLNGPPPDDWSSPDIAKDIAFQMFE